MIVLALNAGSSSVKLKLYEVDESAQSEPPAPLREVNVPWDSSPDTVLERVLKDLHTFRIDVIGHRIVHGGPEFQQPVRITPAVKLAIARVAEIAPVHNLKGLAGIEACERCFGNDIAQFALFDTAFHVTIPPPAYVYPGPYEWLDENIRRYGFHGLNHQYCAHRTAAILGVSLNSLRAVICHLGNGCSITAIRAGQSVDTTMGFTPLEGLMMGTRSGSVDPGILIHLMKRGTSPERLDQILNEESGLKGISCVSSDMREILTAIEAGNARAQLAFDIFIHRLRTSISAMAASASGLDALVFTGGIGENIPLVRAAACEGLQFLGVEVDPARNVSTFTDQALINSSRANVQVLVIKAQEEWQIAKECWHLMAQHKSD